MATSRLLLIAVLVSNVYQSTQLSQVADLTGSTDSVEWNSSGMKSNVLVSVRQTNCSYGQSVSADIRSSATHYYAISRLHCVLICMKFQSSCQYFVFERNRVGSGSGVGITYPASNACDLINSPLDNQFISDPDTDTCVLNQNDVSCVASPCYLMSGQNGCPSQAYAGPTCSCPDGYDSSFCYDAGFHTLK